MNKSANQLFMDLLIYPICVLCSTQEYFTYRSAASILVEGYIAQGETKTICWKTFPLAAGKEAAGQEARMNCT